MFALDIISIFLKFNDVYKKKYRITKSIITKQVLAEIFQF